MGRYLPSTFSDLPPLTITAAIDIVIVAILIYQFLLIIRGRRAVHVLLGLCVLGVIYAWRRLGEAGTAAHYSGDPCAVTPPLP